MFRYPIEPDGLPTLCPNDHLRTIAELLRPGGADLARRWVAALLLVPPEERAALVELIEQRIVDEYTSRGDLASNTQPEPDSSEAKPTEPPPLDSLAQPKPARSAKPRAKRARSKKSGPS